MPTSARTTRIVPAMKREPAILLLSLVTYCTALVASAFLRGPDPTGSVFCGVIAVVTILFTGAVLGDLRRPTLWAIIGLTLMAVPFGGVPLLLAGLAVLLLQFARVWRRRHEPLGWL